MNVRRPSIELVILAALCLRLFLPLLDPQAIEYYPGHGHVVIGAASVSEGLQALAAHRHDHRNVHGDVTVVSVPDQQTFPDWVQSFGGPVLLTAVNMLPLFLLNILRLQSPALQLLDGISHRPPSPPPQIAAS